MYRVRHRHIRIHLISPRSKGNSSLMMKTNFYILFLGFVRYLHVESSTPDPHGDSKVCDKHKCQRRVAKGLLMGHFSGKVIPDYVLHKAKSSPIFVKNENECMKSCVRTEDCAAVIVAPPDPLKDNLTACTIVKEEELTLDKSSPQAWGGIMEKRVDWKIIINGVNKCIEKLKNPCRNGGECKRSGEDLKDYKCTCPKGNTVNPISYSGRNCEKKAPKSYEIRYNDYDTGAKNLTMPETRGPVTFVKDKPGYKLIEPGVYAPYFGHAQNLYAFWSFQMDLTATTWLKFTDISDLIQNKKTIKLFSCQRWEISFDPNESPAPVINWKVTYLARHPNGPCCPQVYSGPAFFNLKCQVDKWGMWNHFVFAFRKGTSGGAQIWLNGKTCGMFAPFVTYGAGNTNNNGQWTLSFLREEPKVGVLTTGIRLYHEYFPSTKILDTYNLERKEFFNLH